MLRLIGLTLFTLSLTLAVVTTAIAALNHPVTITGRWERAAGVSCVNGELVLVYDVVAIDVPKPLQAYKYTVTVELESPLALVTTSPPPVMEGWMRVYVSTNPSLEPMVHFYLSSSRLLSPSTFQALEQLASLYKSSTYSNTFTLPGASSSYTVPLRPGSYKLLIILGIRKFNDTLPGVGGLDAVCSHVLRCTRTWNTTCIRLLDTIVHELAPTVMVSLTATPTMNPVVAARIALVGLAGLAILVFDAHRKPEDYETGMWRLFRWLARKLFS